MVAELKNAWSLGDHTIPKAWYVCNVLNSMFETILSMKIKYYDSRNQNNYVMRKI